jgi:hypothetical protein
VDSFLAVEEGFRYLQELDRGTFLTTELESWKNTENEAYARDLELCLNDAFELQHTVPGSTPVYTP